MLVSDMSPLTSNNDLYIIILVIKSKTVSLVDLNHLLEQEPIPMEITCKPSIIGQTYTYS